MEEQRTHSTESTVNFGGILMSKNLEIEMSERIRGKDIGFERIRRITGYLVGGMERWGDGKKAEEHDRVSHGV